VGSESDERIYGYKDAPGAFTTIGGQSTFGGFRNAPTKGASARGAEKYVSNSGKISPIQP